MPEAVYARLRKPLYDSRLIPGVMVIVTAAIAVFAPAIIALPMGLALFAYFWKHKDKLVIFLLIYTPFEELVLKILPDNLYAPVRFMWEALLFTMMALMLFENKVLGHSWKKSMVDKFMLLFLAAWFLSGFINHIAIISMLAHIKNLIRYIPIFYFIYSLKPGEEFIKKVLVTIISIGVIESLICIGQAIEGDFLVSLFQPREVIVGGQLVRGLDIQLGSYYTKFTGSFIRSNELAYYLVFVICIIVAAYHYLEKKNRYLLALVPVLIALALSSSRISWISAYVGVGIILLKVKKRVPWKYVIIPIVLVLLLIAGSVSLDRDNLYSDYNIISRFGYLFSSDYLDIISNFGRLYVIMTVAPAVFAYNPLLGVGPGSFMRISEQMSADEIYAMGDILNLEGKPLNYVHDVGYVALFVQSGLIGLVAMILVFVFIYRKASRALETKANPLFQTLWLGSLGCMVALAIQNVACFNLMYRNQSILIWALCGLVALTANSKLKADTSNKTLNMEKH
jgi:O-antigen ligase